MKFHSGNTAEKLVLGAISVFSTDWGQWSAESVGISSEIRDRRK